MSFDVQIGDQTVPVPVQSDSPPWGEAITEAIVLLAEQSQGTSGPNDILKTTALIQNTAGQKDISGLTINATNVRSAALEYAITRNITKAISVIPTGSGTITITTSDKHDLFTGDNVEIIGTNSTPSIDGNYSVTKVDDNNFSITIASPVTIAGTTGSFNVNLAENGLAYIINEEANGFSLDRDFGGRDTFVDIEFDSTGQAKYTPTVLEGTSYTGQISFRLTAAEKV